MYLIKGVFWRWSIFPVVFLFSASDGVGVRLVQEPITAGKVVSINFYVIAIGTRGNDSSVI